MKAKIVLSLITGVILFSGCATSNLPFSNKKIAKENIKDYLLSKKYYIFDDSPNKTLILTYNASAGNPPKMSVQDVLDMRDDLKNYCKAKGGQWIDGARYFKLAKLDYLRAFTLINKEPKIDGLGECIAPDGFKAKELGLFNYNEDWQIARGLGGGERVSYTRYYELIYNKPQPTNKDYVVLAYKKFFENTHYDNIDKMVKDLDNLLNSNKDAYYLLTTYPICRKNGGVEYIATDAGTNMQKMKMQNYLFMEYEKLYNKYKDKSERLGFQYTIFPVKEKGYIWCENTANPDNQFMYVWKNGTFHIQKGINKELISNLKTNTASNFTDTNKKIKQSVPKITGADRSAENLAKGVFTMKSDIKVDTNPYVKYYGYYIGKIGNCEYASVNKKTKNMNFIYNFKQCNGNFEYIGQTLKGLTKAEYNRFNPYINALKESCKVNGKAMINVNGYNLYCKSNSSGSALKIFILDSKYRLIDTGE
jgi:hypothetical protein